jgi:hypothetical protein
MSLTIGVASDNDANNKKIDKVKINVVGVTLWASPVLARFYAKQLLLAADFADGVYENDLEAEDKE